ncbi:glycosyltransferase family 2 protein [Clostridium sp. P21]|uniref:Glycosyltransferase family 2 protein n=1 Tax=Clostridium muellerianum TaxID=2716538 RepID=A0A7Y0EGP5_9CLOT|nr:glycosyltransferase family A protein [Clostridium muellerianum]NMM63098.1 glycosyltransferase family 2 protein [Clostridium muellerianum]
MKIITFTVPCYNSEAYMKHCIETLLPGGEDIEIILVDDGSSDGTAKIADDYAAKYPSIIKAIHQENGGHGEAVNTGIKNASGLYFKVVDSDDWLDVSGMLKVIDVLKELHEQRKELDMMMCNYVYEHSVDNTSHVVRYKNVMPENKVFGWNDVGKFKMSQYILMHSVIYRTELLYECGIKLPKHTFYVDNLFVYQPLPYVKAIYYMDIDLYRYFIGREDQSVNEKIMIKRIDQQICVNKLMIDFYCTLGNIENKRLDDYMKNYLSMMLTISSVLLVVSGTKENLGKKKELWSYLKDKDERVYFCMRYRLFGIVSNLWGSIGRKITKYAYYLTSRKYKFN